VIETTVFEDSKIPLKLNSKACDYIKGKKS